MKLEELMEARQSLIGKKVEAWSVSGEYFLGKGTVVALKGPWRVILDNQLDVPVICLRAPKDQELR